MTAPFAPSEQLEGPSAIDRQAHDAAFINQRGFVPTDMSDHWEGLITSGTFEEQYAAAELYVHGNPNSAEISEQFKWNSRLKQRAHTIIALGKMVGNDPEQAVGETLKLEQIADSLDGKQLEANLKRFIAEDPEGFQQSLFDNLDDQKVNVKGIGNVEFGNFFKAGISPLGAILDMGNQSADPDQVYIPKAMWADYQTLLRAAYLEGRNLKGAAKVAQEHLLAKWQPSIQGGRPRFTPFSVEVAFGAVNGSLDWIDDQVLLRAAVRAGLASDVPGFGNTNLARARAQFTSFAKIADGFHEWLLGNPPRDEMFTDSTEEQKTLFSVERYMNSLLGPGPGPKLIMEPTRNAGRTGEPEYNVWYLDQGGSRVMLEESPGVPWVHRPKKETTLAWRQEQAGQKAADESEAETKSINERKRQFERDHGVSYLRALAIEATPSRVFSGAPGSGGDTHAIQNFRGGISRGDEYAHVAEMSAEGRAEMHALAQYEIDGFTEKAASAAEFLFLDVPGAVKSGVGAVVERGIKGLVDVEFGIKAHIGDFFSDGAFSEFILPGGPEDARGFFGGDVDINEYLREIETESFRDEVPEDERPNPPVRVSFKPGPDE